VGNPARVSKLEEERLSEEHESLSEDTVEAQDASTLEWHRREIDPRDNEDTSPPVDERIETCCIWVAECYPPSHAAALVSGLERLGWDQWRPMVVYGDELIGWLEQERRHSYPGAWLNLGRIVRDGDRKRSMASDERIADLPEGVMYAYAYVRSLLPSLTVLTVQFVLDDRGAESLEETARDAFETRVEERDGVHYFANVGEQKREAAYEARAVLRSRCSNWFRDHLPGLFSSGEDETSFPRCEFVVFDKARPFERPSGGGRKDYLWPLGMGNLPDAYEGSTLPGVRLGLPSPIDKDQLALVLAAKREEMPTEEHFRPYGGKNRSGISLWLHQYAEGLMAVWTLNAMLRAYERRLAELRDGIGEIDVQDSQRAAQKVQRAQSRLVLLSTDLLPLTSEVVDLCEKEKSFLGLAPKFESLTEYPWGRLQFGAVYREDLLRRAARARELEGELRQVVMTVGSVVGAISQERSSRANLRLQSRLNFLTWALVFLTVVLVGIGIVTIWVAS
jgi:hypothetical protein